MKGQEVSNALKKIKQGGVILYPTDTVWGIGCDATNEKAIARVYKIKQRSERKSLIILVDSVAMLKNYIREISVTALEVIENAEKPTTVIYNNPNGLASNVVSNDNTIAIRIVQHEFCQELIKQFGKPIVSTSANISIKATPMSFKEIELAILNEVDYVVNLHQEKKGIQASRIIKILENDELQILRD
jgi:L-threonylcarbamoyladenylate synthase